MGKYAEFDFHLHTLWSYDAVTPVEEYFRLAHERNIKTIAITDHHIVDAWDEVKAAGEKYPDVMYIAGAELTVRTPLGSIDMVCLNLPEKPEGDLAEVLAMYHTWQREYGSALSRTLTMGGYPFTDKDRYELLARYREKRCMELQGTTHVQGHLIVDYLTQEKKYFADKAAYGEFMAQYKLPPYPDYDVVLPAVKAAGGLVFIAHPTRYFRRDDLNRMDTLREMLQFDGIECAHNSVPDELSPFYREYCLKHKLLSTAGSDCHSLEGLPYRFCPEHEIGVHNGITAWRDEIAERVKVYNK